MMEIIYLAFQYGRAIDNVASGVWGPVMLHTFTNARTALSCSKAEKSSEAGAGLLRGRDTYQ